MRAATPGGGFTLIDGRCPIAHGLVSARLELAEFNQLALEAMNQLRAGQVDAARRVDDAASALAAQPRRPSMRTGRKGARS